MIFLNVFAVVGALLGLANTALAWRIYGTGIEGDSWMMALAITQSFTLLSQLGVEQAAVYSAEARADSAAAAERFDRDSLTWAIIFGIGFAFLVLLLSAVIINAFARGFSRPEQASVQAAFAPLLLQVAVAPSLFVLRQQLLLKGRAHLAVVLNNVFGAVQFVVLSHAFYAWRSGPPPPQTLAWPIGGGCVAMVMLAILISGERGAGIRVPTWSSLAPFIRASVHLRFTHSIHNFLVVLLMNEALSGGVEGTVARFQYVKKVADGLSAISVGPHLSVYHASQAAAWACGDRSGFLRNVRSYFLTAIPLLIGATLAFLVVAWMAVDVSADIRLRSAWQDVPLFLALLAWQTVVSIETVPAGVLVVQRRPGLLMLVNGLYVAIFYGVIRWLLPVPHSGMAVATASLGCQMASSLLFSMIALKIFHSKFGVASRV